MSFTPLLSILDDQNGNITIRNINNNALGSITTNTITSNIVVTPAINFNGSIAIQSSNTIFALPKGGGVYLRCPDANVNITEKIIQIDNNRYSNSVELISSAMPQNTGLNLRQYYPNTKEAKFVASIFFEQIEIEGKEKVGRIGISDGTTSYSDSEYTSFNWAAASISNAVEIAGQAVILLLENLLISNIISQEIFELISKNIKSKYEKPQK
jgi:hypothetical protein